MTAIESPQQDLSDDSPDAVALFRPTRPEALTAFLDLDEENEECKGIYAEALDDGSFLEEHRRDGGGARPPRGRAERDDEPELSLLFTFQPFEAFAEDPAR